MATLTELLRHDFLIPCSACVRCGQRRLGVAHPTRVGEGNRGIYRQAIRHAERYGTRRPWLTKLLSRRSPRVAAIALANKIGRTAWALMTSGERYREPVVA